jgi:hypothetical protein
MEEEIVYEVSTEATGGVYWVAKSPEEAVEKHLDCFPLDEELDEIQSVKEAICSKCEKANATTYTDEMTCCCSACEELIWQQRESNGAL